MRVSNSPAVPDPSPAVAPHRGIHASTYDQHHRPVPLTALHKQRTLTIG